MFEDITLHRRRFLGGAAMTIVTAQLGMIGCEDAQSSKTGPADATTSPPGSSRSCSPRKSEPPSGRFAS
jgi:hypothetical protein